MVHSMQPGQAYVFTCPICQEEIRIDAGMRDSLLEFGCVVCGSDISSAAFNRM